MFDRAVKERLSQELAILFQERKRSVRHEDKGAAKFGGDEIYRETLDVKLQI